MNISNNSIQYDEFYYAIPNKPSTSKSNESSSNVNVTQEIERLTPIRSYELPSNFEYLNNSTKFPKSFYCKICNNLLNDPRILDCLHSFCVQCLVKLDATRNLENNQFWRKISDTSSELYSHLNSLNNSHQFQIKINPYQYHVQVLNPTRKQNSLSHPI
jgi:hypothetical protein